MSYQASKEASSAGKTTLSPSAWDLDAVRTVNIDESVVAGTSLANSFVTDPLSLYILDGLSEEQKKWDLHVSLMTTVVGIPRSRRPGDDHRSRLRRPGYLVVQLVSRVEVG
ncbi:acetyltransferase [Geosmithia morbida]|uniref:Acetyltransferase n=1 Tax=Geosmithia morbida TaxID=1094350 RepID=A0A9P4Z375_9HYPO|nr:acetyltransferase [Geosmithia morbida]KAF4126686.1 acetyltransferase [Geosmithia morbida]